MKTANKLLFDKATKSEPSPPPQSRSRGLMKGALPIDLGDGYKINLAKLYTTSTARAATTDWAVDLTNMIAYHRNKLP